MASLAILLVVHDETGSFADAGIAVGVFGGVGAALTPALGRLVDCVGQVPVLAVCGTIQPLAFVLLAVEARNGASYVELVLIAALAGHARLVARARTGADATRGRVHARRDLPGAHLDARPAA